MEYLTLAKMKKIYPFCKTADGKQTVLFDLSNLGKTWFTDDVIKQIMPHLEKHIGLDSIQSFIFAIPVSTDDAKLSIDMEFNRTHVYSAKTGKRLYTLKSVSGFRIAEYKRNIFGVVPGNSIPVSVITYGTLDNTWKNKTGYRNIGGKNHGRKQFKRTRNYVGKGRKYH